MPETCWVNLLWINIYTCVICWFSFSYGNDARSHEPEGKEMFKLTVWTQIYVCVNQLHVSVIYSHHQAETCSWVAHSEDVFRLWACIFCFLFVYVQLEQNGDVLLKKKNTEWRRSIATEERLALTLRLVHIPYSLLSPPISEQLNTPQNAAASYLRTFVNVRVVAGKSRTRAGRSQVVLRRPTLIDTYHAVPLPFCALALRSGFQNGMVGARHEHGMVCVCKLA